MRRITYCNEKKLAWQTLQVRMALKFLHRTLKQTWLTTSAKPRCTQVPWSGAGEVGLLEAREPEHRALLALSTAPGCAARKPWMKVPTSKPRMIIHIRAEGNFRQVMLSPSCELLRIYWRGEPRTRFRGYQPPMCHRSA